MWELLYPSITSTLSNGYCNGLFNPQKDKFFAATFVTELSFRLMMTYLDFLMSQFDGGNRDVRSFALSVVCEVAKKGHLISDGPNL